MTLISELLERGASLADEAFHFVQENKNATKAMDFITGSHPVLKLAYLGLILLAVVLLAVRYRSRTGFIKFIREIAIWLLIVVCIVMAITIIAHLKASLLREGQ